MKERHCLKNDNKNAAPGLWRRMGRGERYKGIIYLIISAGTAEMQLFGGRRRPLAPFSH